MGFCRGLWRLIGSWVHGDSFERRGWNHETSEVLLTFAGETLVFAIGETVAGMDVPAQIINGRTFVPIRFVAEYFGAEVDFDMHTGTIDVSLEICLICSHAIR